MLYKFHRINEYLTSLIENNSFWFSKPTEYNDPFDMQFSGNLKSTLEDYELMQKSIKQNIQSEYQTISEKDLSELVSYSLTLLDFDKTINELLTLTLHRFGICCFTESVDNLLMWSHYTDSHKGVCLEFDENILFEIEKSRLVKIKYSNDFPIVNQTNDIEKALLTKSKCWEYENEFRLLSHKQGVVTFPKQALKSIIFGAKAEESEVNRIIKIVNQSGYKNIAFKKARIDDKKYQLNYSDITE
jgi:hypothetical protein